MVLFFQREYTGGGSPLKNKDLNLILLFNIIFFFKTIENFFIVCYNKEYMAASKNLFG